VTWALGSLILAVVGAFAWALLRKVSDRAADGVIGLAASTTRKLLPKQADQVAPKPPAEQPKRTRDEPPEDLDDVSIEILKLLAGADKNLNDQEIASEVGCSIPTATHRLDRLRRMRMIGSLSGGGRYGYHSIVFEGSDWLHRHGLLP
jgi:hypothetical protein